MSSTMLQRILAGQYGDFRDKEDRHRSAWGVIDPSAIKAVTEVYFRLTNEIATEETLTTEIGYVYCAQLFRKKFSNGQYLTYYSYPYAKTKDGWLMVDRPWCDLEKAVFYSSYWGVVANEDKEP